MLPHHKYRVAYNYPPPTITFKRHTFFKRALALSWCCGNLKYLLSQLEVYRELLTNEPNLVTPHFKAYKRQKSGELKIFFLHPNPKWRPIQSMDLHATKDPVVLALTPIFWWADYENFWFAKLIKYHLF